VWLILSAMQVGKLKQSIRAAIHLIPPAAILVFTGLAIGQKTQKESAPPTAGPEEVCAFIADQMRQAVPQTPTLCSGKQGRARGYYHLNIFTPTNALQDKMRRAWSSNVGENR